MLSKAQTKQYFERTPVIPQAPTLADTGATRSPAPTRKTRRGVETPVLAGIGLSIAMFAGTPLLAAAHAESNSITGEELPEGDWHIQPPIEGKPKPKPARTVHTVHTVHTAHTNKAKPSQSTKSMKPAGPGDVREWMPSRGSECFTRGPNKGFCFGPRRVPKPHGSAAALAEKLGLGERQPCSWLLGKAPPDEWIAAAQASGAANTWKWPVDSERIVRGVGNLAAAERRRVREFSPNYKAPARRPHHDHEGIDIAAPEGTPIHAVQNGLVVYSDNALTGYGNLVIVLHKDGSVALYAHCRSTFVFPGQRVERGQVVGEVGHTGFAQGPHLHFEYRVNGFAQDPLEHFHDEFIPRALAAANAPHASNTSKHLPAR